MLAVLLTLTGRTMVRLMRAESTGIEALADTMSTDRMARDFRADLHDARTVALGVGDDDTVRLVLEREDGSVITWSGTDQRVLRHRRSADGVGSQDEYRVGASRVTWEWRADEQLAAIALHRIPAPHSKTPAQATVPLSDSVPARLRIEAVAARLVQVSSASSSEEARP
ncbi:MAG: hypothetical protein R3B90_04205 [Planctomycetaceae bacterium]